MVSVHFYMLETKSSQADITKAILAKFPDNLSSFLTPQLTIPPLRNQPLVLGYASILIT